MVLANNRPLCSDGYWIVRYHENGPIIQLHIMHSTIMILSAETCKYVQKFIHVMSKQMDDDSDINVKDILDDFNDCIARMILMILSGSRMGY